MDYENMGVFAQIQGLLFARPYGYTDAQRRQLREVVSARTEAFGFPVVMDMDFGHTSPMFTLPIGCRAMLDTEAQRFAITEAAVL